MLILIILDGFGLNERRQGNAIAPSIKNLDNLMKNYPFIKLKASGEAVGLPSGLMGNSEVGHLNLGAGRIVYQDICRINKSIETGEFFKNPVLLKAIFKAKNNKKEKKLHLIGLLSDGGVHSHINHLYALLELANRHNLDRVYIHAILDGRDTPPKSADQYIMQLEEWIKKHIMFSPSPSIASIMGRYYAMDRDKRWHRTKKAYDALTKGIGESANTALEAINNAYERGETDEFVLPTVIISKNKPIATIENKDSVIFFNFRPDRARQITRAFVDKDFNSFEREEFINPYFVCMTQYDENLPAPVAYHVEYVKNTLGEVLSKNNLKQLRIAETEKYAHVTFFFNGGKEKRSKGEDWCLIPSPKKVATYDLKPEMSAYEVTDKVLEKINKYDVIILNYANCDMVGHTGKYEAAVKAVKTVDECVGRIVQQVQKMNGIAIITADHGNADQMIYYESRRPHTAHTTNPVPFILVSNKQKKIKLRNSGILADVAPTILDLLGIDKPMDMTGESLLGVRC